MSRVQAAEPGTWRLQGLRGVATMALAVLLAGSAGRAWWTASDRVVTAAARPAAPTDPAARALVARCRIAMANGVCRAMPVAGAASTPATPASIGPVFVVGIGTVDPEIIARLNRDGEAMCDTVGATCGASPDDPLCRVAQVLYR